MVKNIYFLISKTARGKLWSPCNQTPSRVLDHHALF